jgi:endonuclease/exonuclease/phosphatase family metal-dependent hydrolase
VSRAGLVLALLLAPLLGLGCREEPAVTGGSPSEGGGGGVPGGGGSGGVGGSPATDVARIVTWNVERFPKTSESRAAAVSVIEAIEPDLVGLQEVADLAELDDLEADLGTFRAIPAQSGDGFGRVALLYDESRVAVGEVETLFESDGYAFPRPALKARVRLLGEPSNDFIFGVVHLKAMLDDESADRRRAACEKIDQWIRAAAQEGLDSEFVFVGDFNDQLTDSPSQNVFGPLLQSTDGGFLTLPLEQAGAFTYLPFESMIDHAFVWGLPVFEASSAEVVDAREIVPDYEDTVSDHLPVSVTLRFPPR